MHSLVVDKVGAVSFAELPEPLLDDEHLLLKVSHVGLCGSDLNTFRGTNPLVSYPRVPGHEIGGTIIERGANVPIEFGVGKQAIVIPYTECGACSACKVGRTNACQFNKTLGVQQDGGMCSRISVHPDRIILNETLPLPHKSLVEPLSVGFHAVKRGAVTKEDTVIVQGAGAIGVGAVIGALARGAKVIVLEVSDAKKNDLAKLGVNTVLNPKTHDIAREVNALTDGHGADVVIEAVGLADTFRSAVDLVCFAGRVVYVGYAKDEVSYNTSLFNLKELDIRGSRNSTRKDFLAVITFLEAHPQVAEIIISKIVPWAEADQAFVYWESVRDSMFKIMVELESSDVS